MASERVWVRGELPFLRSGPMWRIHEDALPELDAMLARHGYVRIELDGRRMTSRKAAHAVFAEAFGFPDWYGGNWDAFHDCFYGFASDHADERVAVIWRHLDAAAAAAPATLAEVGWALLECATGHWPTPGPTQSTTMQFDLFAIGTGDDFDRPEPVISG
ncbi:MAG: barstar family protein [Thermomicrobiales bacterium]